MLIYFGSKQQELLITKKCINLYLITYLFIQTRRNLKLKTAQITFYFGLNQGRIVKKLFGVNPCLKIM